MMALTVVDAKPQGEYLFVTVQGNDIGEVTSAEARRLAWDERHKHGYSNAGIEAYGGSFPVDLMKKGADGQPAIIEGRTFKPEPGSQIAYRALYRLLRGL
jgi:hypothetical protein